MVCWNGAVLTMTCGAPQVRPPSRVTDINVGPVTNSLPSGLDCSRAQTGYARPARTRPVRIGAHRRLDLAVEVDRRGRGGAQRTGRERAGPGDPDGPGCSGVGRGGG